MKAVRWFGRRDIRIDDLPEPKVGKGEVKVKITWSGICGTDVHEFTDGPIFIPVDVPHKLTGQKAPITIGHEFGGYVVEVGEDVKSVQVGDLVAVMPLMSCGKCIFCQENRPNLCPDAAYRGLMGDGGMTEFIVVPEKDVQKFPEGVAPELVAFGEPFAVAVHALNRVGGVKGRSVSVVGAGPIGLIVAKVAEHLGAKPVIIFESDIGRRQCAKRLGFNHVFDPHNKSDREMFKALTNGLGTDVTVDAGGSAIIFEPAFPVAGLSSLQISFDITRPGGQVVLVAIHFPQVKLNMATFLSSEKSLYASWLYLPEEFEQGVKVIVELADWVPKLITRKIFIDSIVEEGLLELELYRAKHIKILVTPHHEFL